MYHCSRSRQNTRMKTHQGKVKGKEAKNSKGNFVLNPLKFNTLLIIEPKPKRIFTVFHVIYIYIYHDQGPSYTVVSKLAFTGAIYT